MPKLQISRTILRILIWLLVLLYMQHRFSWASLMFGRFLVYPEIRVRQYEPRHAIAGSEWITENIALVQNRGNASAEGVYVHATAPVGRILRYDVVSEEPYSIREDQPFEGRLGVWLNRLSPNATVTVYVWATEIEKSALPLRFSVTADHGSIRPYHTLTAEEEVSAYVDRLVKAAASVIVAEQFETDIDQRTTDIIILVLFALGFYWLFIRK